MPSLGPAEILVILVIALLVFGPNKMPDIARQLGRGIREFKRAQQHLTGELRDVVSEFDTPSPASDAPLTADTALAPDGARGGDPVPTLPPRVETPDPAPAPPEAPVERGQRVWPPRPSDA
jgi:sec-independent protein translocase protein TatA